MSESEVKNLIKVMNTVSTGFGIAGNIEAMVKRVALVRLLINLAEGEIYSRFRAFMSLEASP